MNRNGLPVRFACFILFNLVVLHCLWIENILLILMTMFKLYGPTLQEINKLGFMQVGSIPNVLLWTQMMTCLI